MARTKKQNPHTYSPTTTTPSPPPPYSGRGGPNAWNTHEKSLFQQGVLTHGWGAWRFIEPMIPTRTRAQIKSHAQKFKIHHPILVTELLERRHFHLTASAANRGGGREGLSVSVASSTMKSAAAAKRRRDNIKMKKKAVIDIYNDANITNANAISNNDDGGVTPPNKTHSNNIDNRPTTTPRRNKRSMTLLPPAAAVAAKKKKKAQHEQQQSPDNSDSNMMVVTDDTNKSITKQAKYKALSLSSSTKPYCNKARSGTVAIAKVRVKVQPKTNKALSLPLRWSTSRSIASSSSSSSPLRRSARKTSKCSSSHATPSLYNNNNNNKHTISTPTKKPRKNNEVTIQRYNATAPFRILHPVDVVGMKKNVVSPATTATPTTPGGTTGKPTSTNAAANAVNVNISSPSSLSNAVNVARSITVVTPTDNISMPCTTTTTNDGDSIHQEEEDDDELAVLAASVADIHPEEQEQEEDDDDDDNDYDGSRKKECDTLDITSRQILPQELAWLEQCSLDTEEQFDKFDNDIMSIDLSEDTIDALSLSSSFGSMEDNNNADDNDEDDEDEDEYEPHQLFDIKNGGGNGGGVDDLNLKIDDEDIAGMLSSFLMNPTSSSSENNNKDDEKDKLMEEADHHPSGGEKDNGHITRSSIVPRAQELGGMDPPLPGHRTSYYNYFGQDYTHSSFMTTAPSRRDPPALAPTTPTTPPQHPPILLTTTPHPQFINKVRPDPNAYQSIHAHLTSAPDYNNPKEYVAVSDDDNGLVSRMGREKGELCRARLRDYLIGEHLEVEWWKKNGAAAAGAADSNSHRRYHCHDNLNDASASSSSSSALASNGGGGRTNGDNNAAWTSSVIMALPPLGQSGTLGGLGEVLAQKSSSSSSIGGGSSETCKRELLNFHKKSALERLIAITAVMTQVDHWHTLSMAGSVPTTSATTTSSDGTTTTTLLMETAAAAAARRFNEEDDIRAIGQLVKGLWERVNRSLGRDNYTLLGNSSGVVGDDNDCIFARMERNDAINSMVMRLDLLSRQE